MENFLCSSNFIVMKQTKEIISSFSIHQYFTYISRMIGYDIYTTRESGRPLTLTSNTHMERKPSQENTR